MAIWTWKGIRSGIVSTSYPAISEAMPEGYRGKPEIDPDRCRGNSCDLCAKACLPKAIVWGEGPEEKVLTLDYTRCIFCGLCEEVCPEKAINLTQEFELASLKKEDLTVTVRFPGNGQEVKPAEAKVDQAGEKLRREIQRIFGRSLHIRHVDAGSCNGCESELEALNNPYYNLHRLGIFFTPSPRFADLLLVTGPITRQMETPLRETYEAMPDPKWVAAVGACACSGGIFPETALTAGGLDKILPVDVYIPGCPPNPLSLIQGLLLVIGRIEQKVKRQEVVR